MTSIQIKTPSDNWGFIKKNNRQIMHQAKTFSNKDLDNFQKPIDIIGADGVLAIGDVTVIYALLDSFNCIVRDRLSKNASNNSVTGISNAIATRSRVSTLGADLPLNQADQFFISTPVKSLNSLRVKVKNLPLFVGSLANIVAKIVECVGYLTNIAQTRKHPLARMFSKDPVPRCRGVDRFIHLLALFRGWFHYEYNTFVATLVRTKQNAMPSHADMGGGVMKGVSTASIPTGREGYIYLIHAEGTNRYKIGRSVNPIARAADIQKQSPYQLKIVRSAWTLDASGDEASLHKRYAEWRVFGEWFELDQLLEDIDGSTEKSSVTRLYAVECEFKYLSPTMRGVAEYSIKKLGDFLNCNLHSFDKLGSQLIGDINRLYGQASSRLDVQATQEFITYILPQIVLERYQSNHDELLMVLADDRAKEYGFEWRLISFMAGAIATFRVLSLNKGVR